MKLSITNPLDGAIDVHLTNPKHKKWNLILISLQHTWHIICILKKKYIPSRPISTTVGYSKSVLMSFYLHSKKFTAGLLHYMLIVFNLEYFAGSLGFLLFLQFLHIFGLSKQIWWVKKCRYKKVNSLSASYEYMNNELNGRMMNNKM